MHLHEYTPPSAPPFTLSTPLVPSPPPPLPLPSYINLIFFVSICRCDTTWNKLQQRYVPQYIEQVILPALGDVSGTPEGSLKLALDYVKPFFVGNVNSVRMYSYIRMTGIPIFVVSRQPANTHFSLFEILLKVYATLRSLDLLHNLGM